MKLTYEQKLKAYEDWKNRYKSAKAISKELNIRCSGAKYFLRLADKHGVEILRHCKNKYYSSEEKIRIINRVLIDNESILSVSIDEGLSGDGLLLSWIKSYRENGYTVVEKKRGRHPNGQEDGETTCSKRSTEKTECGATQAERDSYDTTRILKKIRCLSYGKRKARKEEIAQAVTELRQETKRSLSFILSAINSSDQLPHITRSDYYYWCNHTDMDIKNDELMNKIIEIYY